MRLTRSYRITPLCSQRYAASPVHTNESLLGAGGLVHGSEMYGQAVSLSRPTT